MPNILDLLPKESFLREWPGCWPDCEAPDSYFLFTAISALGAVLGRNVWLPYGDMKVLPVVPTILLGPPGIGKTRTILYGKKLIESLPMFEQPAPIPASTKEEMLASLSFTPHAIMYATELASFFSTEKYKEGVVPMVTDLLDFPDEKRNATRKDGVLIIKKPTLTIMGASTVSWFQERLPKSANDGGFLARFIVLHEDQKGRSVGLAGDRSEKEERIIEHKREKTFALFRTATSHRGPMRMDSWGAKDVFVPWKMTYVPPAEVADTFASRKEEFVLRLAINIALSCGKMIIDEDHMQAAVGLYEYAMTTLAKVIIPFTPIGKAQAQILKMAGREGATDKELCRRLSNSFTSQDILKWISSLEFSGKLIKREEKYFEAGV